MSEMIASPEDRIRIAQRLADAINDVVREQYTGLHEEPDITSRIGQRLEDRFDGKTVGRHTIRVITQTLPSHGPNSLEKPLGTDLYIALSVRPHRGKRITKGLLIQAKRGEKLKGEWSDLREQCKRMNLVTKKGSVVWLYGPNGVSVMRAVDVAANLTAVSSLSEMLNEVFVCQVGDKRKVPAGGELKRPELGDMLTTLGAKNGVLLKLRQVD